MIKYRLLMISPIASHPSHQGNSARIQILGSELMGRGFEIDFLYYGMEGLTEDQRRDMTSFWTVFHFVPAEPLKRMNLGKIWGLDDWAPEVLVLKVKSLCDLIDFDAVIVNYVWMSKVLEVVTSAKKILDTHDIFAERQLVLERSNIEPTWYFTSTEEEDRGFARADLVIGIQDEESEAISRRFSGFTLTVGHAHPANLFEGRELDTLLYDFGYMGSANPLNIQSVIELDEKLASFGEFNWALAGSISSRRLFLHSSPYDIGRVESVSAFYKAVRCVINPMSGGTGLKIKTIEALAYGKPIIGTVDAFKGIDTFHPFHRIHSMKSFVEAMDCCRKEKGVLLDLQIASIATFINYSALVNSQIDRLVEFIAGDIFNQI